MSSPLSRPFDLQLELPRSLDEIEVRVEFGADVQGTARVASSEIMITFAALGASGALGGLETDPLRSHLHLADERISQRRGRWLFAGVEIDPRSLWILLNMIQWLHQKMVAVLRVVVAWPENRRPHDMEMLEYPELWQEPPFELEFGDMLGDIDLAIDFESAQPKAVTDRVVHMMSNWLLATHRGAYANDSFDPAESRVYLGPDVMTVTPSRVVWYIESMRCDEGALDGLLNLLVRVNHDVAAIRRVEVGP